MSDSGNDDAVPETPISLPNSLEPSIEATIGRIGAVEEEEPEPEVMELEKDTVFELLKNRRRRDVIRFLSLNDGQATLSDVAEFVAAEENGIPVNELTSKQRKRVYVALYQCHLPMMDRAGVIDYNRARGVLTERTEAEQLATYLTERVHGNERWSQYLAVTGLGGLMYLFGAILLGPGSIFTTGTVFGLVAAVLTLSLLDGRDAIGGTVSVRQKMSEMTAWIGRGLESIGGRLSDSESNDRSNNRY